MPADGIFIVCIPENLFVASDIAICNIFHIQILINIPLWIGFICYGLGSLLMILALKYGDLSLVYPFIALSFVWVNILSIIFFSEHVKILNWLGITAIIIGVSLIGYGSSRLKK